MAKEIQDTLVPVRDNQLVYRTEFENIYENGAVTDYT